MMESMESALRATLEHSAQAMPVPADPWSGYARREAAHRRGRRVRAGVVAGLVVAAVGVQTNVIPLPGWAPGVALASQWSALAQGPTRGSLAGDLAWLGDFRRQIRDVQDPDGLWRVADRGAIRVIYAGDVPGHRLALVLVPLRLGLITDATLIWYAGPAGAAAGQMTESSRDSAADIPVTAWMDSDAEHGGVAVVVGPPGGTVAISDGFSYSPAGLVIHHQTSTSAGTGIGVAVLPPSPLAPGVTTRVTEGGKVIYAGPVYGSWSADQSDAASQDPTDAMLADAVRGARGPVLDRAILTSFMTAALQDSRLPAADVTVRLRWSGTVDGAPAALLTVQPTGGGVLVYAMHGGARSFRTDLRLLLPAAGADARPIGWRMRAEGKDDRTDGVRVVAPAGAASASISIAGGTAVPVPLDQSGFGRVAVPPDQPAVVTAFAADGTALASTPVPPFENDSGGLPGDTPLTRIVN